MLFRVHGESATTCSLVRSKYNKNQDAKQSANAIDTRQLYRLLSLHRLLSNTTYPQ